MTIVGHLFFGFFIILGVLWVFLFLIWPLFKWVLQNLLEYWPWQNRSETLSLYGRQSVVPPPTGIISVILPRRTSGSKSYTSPKQSDRSKRRSF